MLDGALERLRDPGSRERGERRTMAGIDAAHERAEAGPVQGRDAADRAERREREPAPDVGSQRGAGFVRGEVPFVERDHRSPSAVEDEPQQGGVLGAHSAARVEQDDRDVGVRDRLERLDDAELLDLLRHPRAAPDPRGVDQDVALSAVPEGHLDAVARGARRVMREHSRAAGEPVDEGGFSGVGPSDDADPDTLLAVAGRARPVLREHPGQRGGKAVDASAMRRRDRDRVAEAQRMEIDGGGGFGESVDLVGGHGDRFAAAPQPIRDAPVRAGEARSRIEHQHQQRGFFDRERGLIRDELRYRVAAVGQTPGIDHHDVASSDARVAVTPVARQSRQVRDERVARARQGVEQCRLADVRAADERKRRQHVTCSDANPDFPPARETGAPSVVRGGRGR